MRALLLVSLGPVQEFIASARRCQDLWFGSFLLSDLSRAAAKQIREIAGGECLVFPGSPDDDDGAGAGVANKILASVGSVDDARAIAEAARTAIGTRLKELAELAFRKVTAFDNDRANRQLAELMECD